MYIYTHRQTQISTCMFVHCSSLVTCLLVFIAWVCGSRNDNLDKIVLGSLIESPISRFMCVGVVAIESARADGYRSFHAGLRQDKADLHVQFRLCTSHIACIYMYTHKYRI